MNEKVFHNIPANSIKVVDSRGVKEKREIHFMTNVTLLLNGFALIQLIKGAALSFAIDISKSNVLLYTRLVDALIELNDNAATLELERTEVITFKLWLELRMRHCEEERDARNPKFNPDTYIGQKLLLLDLRELLLGELE